MLELEHNSVKFLFICHSRESIAGRNSSFSKEIQLQRQTQNKVESLYGYIIHTMAILNLNAKIP